MKIKNVFQLCALTAAMSLGVAACNEKKEETPPAAEMPADAAHGAGDAAGGAMAPAEPATPPPAEPATPPPATEGGH